MKIKLQRRWCAEERERMGEKENCVQLYAAAFYFYSSIGAKERERMESVRDVGLKHIE